MKKVCHIIVVEDNKVDLFIIRQFLKKKNTDWNILEFEAATEAIKFFNTIEEKQFADLIITDLNMPAISGHEVIQAIRANPILAEVPIAVLTSSAAQKDRELAYKYGANSFTTKPLTFDKADEILALLGPIA
jgi:CheY-like chemotaxis protein